MPHLLNKGLRTPTRQVGAVLKSSLTAVRGSTGSIPPNFEARIGQFETFVLPQDVQKSAEHQALGKAMMAAWRKDGILQITASKDQNSLYQEILDASHLFFRRPRKEKAACVDTQSYSGYIASGEEITNEVADYSEIFTVTKDLPYADPRVADKWPCHGPCPWPKPDLGMKAVVNRYMGELSMVGDIIIRLIELGLELPNDSLYRYVRDGWHHMRILRFPSCDQTSGRGQPGRGIGPHTDYGLLVIAAQDDVGGLFIRSPRQNDGFANWKNAAGSCGNDGAWAFVPPVPGVLTVFPGDMLQYMTNSVLHATPHKVGLNTAERFAFAYFHEPDFRAIIRPLPGYDRGQEPAEGVHYGTHFTNMALRNYPHRSTTRRLISEGRYDMLSSEELRCEFNQPH